MIAMQPVGIVRGGRAEASDDSLGAGRGSDRDRRPLHTRRFARHRRLQSSDRCFLHAPRAGGQDRHRRAPSARAQRLAAGRHIRAAGPAAPNRIGVTTVELLEVAGATLRVRGLDAIDGTPVLDLKPYISGFAPRSAVREPAWVKELMKDYW